jgi:hypothetical protein
MGFLDWLQDNLFGSDKPKPKPSANKPRPQVFGYQPTSRTVSPYPTPTARRSNNAPAANRPAPLTFRDMGIGADIKPPVQATGGYGAGLGVLSRQSTPQNIMDMLAGMQTSVPDVGSLFSPQYAAIQQAEQQARENYERGRAAMASGYEGLVGNIRAQNPVLANIHNTATNQVNQAANTAVNDVNKSFDESEAKQAALRKQLGLDPGGATSEAAVEAQRQQDFLTGLLKTSQAANTGLLANQGASAQTFNTSQGNIAGQEGQNVQAQLLQGLNQGLGDLQVKRLETDADRASATMDAYESQRDFDWDQQKFMIQAMMENQAAQEAAQAQAASVGNENQTPWEKVYQQAIGGAQGDTRMADKAMDLISGVSMGGMPNTMADFIRMVAAANGADGRPGRGFLPSQYMRSIASSYWDMMDPRAPLRP